MSYRLQKLSALPVPSPSSRLFLKWRSALSEIEKVENKHKKPVARVVGLYPSFPFPIQIPSNWGSESPLGKAS